VLNTVMSIWSRFALDSLFIGYDQKTGNPGKK